MPNQPIPGQGDLLSEPEPEQAAAPAVDELAGLSGAEASAVGRLTAEQEALRRASIEAAYEHPKGVHDEIVGSDDSATAERAHKLDMVQEAREQIDKARGDAA
jgi:hypothetical protein